MEEWWLLIILLAIIGLGIYFLPTFLAIHNAKRNTVAIFVLNFLTGWSFIGWVIALVWALTRDRESS